MSEPTIREEGEEEVEQEVLPSKTITPVTSSSSSAEEGLSSPSAQMASRVEKLLEEVSAARAAAEAAGEDQAAQEQAAKAAFDREDDRTPEERETFKQVCGLCRRHRTWDYRCSHAFSQRAHARPLAPRRRASSR